MKQRIVTLVIAGLLSVMGVQSQAIAETFDQTLPHHTRVYKAYWGGIAVGELYAELAPERVTTAIQALGIAKMVSKYRSYTVSEFHPPEESGQSLVIPSSFRTEFSIRDRARTINIDYNSDGTIKHEEVIPPENRAKRPAVADDVKLGAADPLTAILLARRQIALALEKEQSEFSVKVYDGRRLATFNMALKGAETIRYGRKKHDVLRVEVTRDAIAGYTNNEKKRIKDGEDPVTMLYLEKETLLPLKAEADAPLGSAVVRLVRTCQSMSHCGADKAMQAYFKQKSARLATHQ